MDKHIQEAVEQSRRAFIKKSGVLFATGTLGLSLAACDSMENEDPDDPGSNTGISLNGTTLSVDLGVQTGLQNSGGFLLIGTASGTAVNVFIVNDGTEIKAFTAVCTHQSCNVNNYNPTTQRIICPCHGSEFDLNGNPQTGPAPSALEEYTVTRSGDTVTVSLT